MLRYMVIGLPHLTPRIFNITSYKAGSARYVRTRAIDQRLKRRDAGIGMLSNRSTLRGSEAGETMTMREKELFNNIFQSLLSRKVKEKETEEDVLHFGQQSGSSSTMDSAQRPSTKDAPIKLAEEYLQAFPPSIQREAEIAASIVQQTQARADAKQEAIEARRSSRYLEAREALLACKTSAELYSFLEDKVFRPFVQNEVSLEGMSMRSKSELSDFCRAYPMLLAETMMILRLSYRDYSAAVSVFSRIQELGVKSEVIGTNTAVCNELILATFEGWHDVALVDDILTAMDADGIHGDEDTIEILKMITSSIIKEREGSETGMIYWSLAKPRKLESLNRRVRQLSRTVFME